MNCDSDSIFQMLEQSLDGLEPNYFHFFDKPGFVKAKRFLLKSETFKINNSNLENSL